MSADLVLRDAALEAGLGASPTRDLALYAAAQGGDLGALGDLVLEGGAAPVPWGWCRPLPRSWHGAGTGQRTRVGSTCASRDGITASWGQTAFSWHTCGSVHWHQAGSVARPTSRRSR